MSDPDRQFDFPQHQHARATEGPSACSGPYYPWEVNDDDVQSETGRIGLQSAEHRGGHPFLPEDMGRVAERWPEHGLGHRVKARFGDRRWVMRRP